jgi:hypothetical protein
VNSSANTKSLDAKSLRKIALSLSEPLADAMQMRLTLRDQLGRYSIFGNGDFELPLLNGTTLALQCDVVASTVTLGTEAWVLAKVSKDLYVLLVYSIMGGLLSLAIVDGKEFDVQKIAAFKGASAEAVVASCANKIKAMFQRDRFKSEWRKLDEINDPMDRGQDELPQAGHRKPFAGWGY